MPIAALELEPGINTTLTASANRRGYAASQLIRWRNGLPEKMGGWSRITSQLLIGVCRALHAWADLQGNPYAIAASAERVQLYDGGQLYDITPLRNTVSIAVSFDTTSGDSLVTIEDVTHGAAAGDWIYITTQVSVGGLIIYGYYQIQTITDADHYVIDAGSNATSTVAGGGTVAEFDTTLALATVDVTLPDHGYSAGDLYTIEVDVTVGGLTLTGSYTVTSITDADHFVITSGIVATSTDNAFQNGGQVQILYLLASGLTSAEFLSGYGIGDYGDGDYGLGSSSTGGIAPLRQWFWDQWGEQALGNYTNGPFYVWVPPLASSPRATLIGGTSPTQNTASFVSMPQQIAVALGTETGGVFDPNLVRWCSVADYGDWVATVINQAGSFRIPSGSKIVGGLQGPGQAFIWTDVDLWSMRYIGPPFVFSFTKIGEGCGLLAARCIAVMGGEVYWASTNGVWKYGNGGVQPVDCSVYDVMFGESLTSSEPVLNRMQVDKCFAAPHVDIQEFTLFFPTTTGDGEPDTYIKMNIGERDKAGNPLWDYGTLGRTAWEGESALGRPIGADRSNLIQQHETGRDADGTPMVSWVRTGLMDLQDGWQFVFIDQLEPDAKSTVDAVLDVTVYSRKTPRGPERSFGPYRFDDVSGYIRPRVRGKYIAFEMGSSDLGSWWRMGLNRYRYAPDGKGG